MEEELRALHVFNARTFFCSDLGSWLAFPPEIWVTVTVLTRYSILQLPSAWQPVAFLLKGCLLQWDWFHSIVILLLRLIFKGCHNTASGTSSWVFPTLCSVVPGIGFRVTMFG